MEQALFGELYLNFGHTEKLGPSAFPRGPLDFRFIKPSQRVERCEALRFSRQGPGAALLRCRLGRDGADGESGCSFVSRKAAAKPLALWLEEAGLRDATSTAAPGARRN